jgi:hypothetical protein
MLCTRGLVDRVGERCCLTDRSYQWSKDGYDDKSDEDTEANP